MLKRRIFAVAFLLVLFCGQFSSAAGEVVTISDKADFLAFCKDCTLDTWSQQKTVRLLNDIDLSGETFFGVPTFGGRFDGGGHTVSGVKIDKSGSAVGLFRYVQNGAVVSELNVQGEITPGGSKSFAGGIAGVNDGIIQNCSFDGTVSGENVIGGIAGENSASGRILSCRTKGTVTGENATGGIAGKNEGLLQSCLNRAQVNTVYKEKKRSLTDLDTDAGAIVESYRTKKEEQEEDSVLGHSDTGGIVGYTSGIVQGCENRGAVGYQHIGYNVGGIAGRQSGYLLGCENYGVIQGRKDVGGIVGQMEPYVLLTAKEAKLKDLRGQIGVLHTMIDRLITDSDALGDDTKGHLSILSEHAKTARDSTQSMLDQGTAFVDDNMAEVNAQAAILSDTAERFISVFDGFASGASDASDALQKTKDALDGIDIGTPDLSDDISKISGALTTAASAEQMVENASERMKKALAALQDFARYKNPTKGRQAVEDLKNAVADFVQAKQAVKTAAEDIETIVQERPESIEALGGDVQKISENLKTIKENADKQVTALKTISDSLDTLSQNTEIDLRALRFASDNMESAIDSLNEAAKDISAGLRGLSDGLTGAQNTLDDYTSDAEKQITDAKEKLSQSMQTLSFAADDIETAMTDSKQILSDLSAEKDLELVTLGEDFQTASSDLFDSLAHISDEIGALKDGVSEKMDLISGDLSRISEQFNQIMLTMLDELEDLQSTDSLSDYFLDVSDEAIESTTQGKVANCRNFGDVQADRNTGGIAGSLAIEYAKDPEDEIEKPTTLNFTYRTKAVLQGCINDGAVTGKKDCTGGVVGFAELGTVYGCENYGAAVSDGGYVGGIAGKSSAPIRKCYAKGEVAGDRYVGGIAGKTDSLSACCSIVTVTGTEWVGAVAGDCKQKDRLTGCLFVDSGTGGVDGISYRGKATPVSYAQMTKVPGVPRRFISFQVTFTADGQTVETQNIRYGDSTQKIKFPDVPAKEGMFGKWEAIEDQTVTRDITVTCSYQPYITVLASAEKNESGKLPLALAEGAFTDEAVLHVTKSDTMPPVQTPGTAVYDIRLENTEVPDGEPVTLRLVNEKRQNVKAWQYVNGAWQEADTKYHGKYVILQTTGTQSTVCLQYTDRNVLWLFILLPLLIAAAVTVFLWQRKKRRASVSA